MKLEDVTKDTEPKFPHLISIRLSKEDKTFIRLNKINTSKLLRKAINELRGKP